jgi:hypothetical protein
MEPLDVALGPISGSGLSLTSMLTLRARTRVVVGEQPPVSPKALPSLRLDQANAQAANDGIRIPFDVELPYAEANRLMAENFAKQTYEGVAVDSIRLGPAANGRVSVELNVRYHESFFKRYSGLVYLEGTPLFDAATRTISLQNLDYSIDPRRKNPFLRIADRVAHEKLRATLARTAHWSMAPQIDSIRGEIARAVTRPLAPGVMMRGTLGTIEPAAVSLDANGIVVHALATGNAEVEISALR